MAEWAETHGILAEHCPISNTSDSDLHLVVAVYHEEVVGVGIDAVWMPRMERHGKNRDYLLRFARQFMSEREWSGFAARYEEASEDDLRCAVMAHFSLMEAASKACGTGLKIGLGMGRSASLPKQSLGVETLSPVVSLLIEDEAVLRLQELGVNRSEAYWGAEADFILALVLFYRTPT
jgi:phosphopantetheinyl transferase (holo-ACP synthase)